MQSIERVLLMAGVFVCQKLFSLSGQKDFNFLAHILYTTDVCLVDETITVSNQDRRQEEDHMFDGGAKGANEILSWSKHFRRAS